MTEGQPVEMTIALVGGADDAQARDSATRRLLAEIRRSDVSTATLARGQPPPGAKAGVDTVNAILAGVVSGAIPVFMTSVQGWLRRQRDGSAIRLTVGSKSFELRADTEETPALVDAIRSAAADGEPGGDRD